MTLIEKAKRVKAYLRGAEGVEANKVTKFNVGRVEELVNEPDQLKDEFKELGLIYHSGLPDLYRSWGYFSSMWSYTHRGEGQLWRIDGYWSYEAISSIGPVSQVHLIGDEGEFLPDHLLTPLGRLIKHEGYLELGANVNGGTLLLLCPEGSKHELALLLPGHDVVYPLIVDLETFLNITIDVGAISQFPFYLTADYPEPLKSMPYDGFFEKAARLFPDADLSVFNRHGFASGTMSVVQLYGKYGFTERILKAFDSVPAKAFYRKWHLVDDVDVLVFTGYLEEVRMEQVITGLRMSSALEAYFLESQKFSVTWGMNNELLGNFEIYRLVEFLKKNHGPEYYKVSAEMGPELVGKYALYSDPYNDILVSFEGDGKCHFHLLYLEGDGYETHFITDDFDWLMSMLLNARGMFWWNYYLVFKPSAVDLRYDEFYNNMRTYFPDADMSRYPDPETL